MDENEFVVLWKFVTFEIIAMHLSHFYWDTLYSFSSSYNARKKVQFQFQRGISHIFFPFLQ